MGNLYHCDCAEGIQKKSPVFEKSKNQKVYGDCKNKILFTAFGILVKMIDLQCHVIIKKAGKQHKNHIYRIAPGIKDQAANKKQNIPELLRYKVIEKQERG